MKVLVLVTIDDIVVTSVVVDVTSEVVDVISVVVVENRVGSCAFGIYAACIGTAHFAFRIIPTGVTFGAHQYTVFILPVIIRFIFTPHIAVTLGRLGCRGSPDPNLIPPITELEVSQTNPLSELVDETRKPAILNPLVMPWEAASPTR